MIPTSIAASNAPPGGKVLLGLLGLAVGRQHLVHGADHGEHDAHGTLGVGLQYCPETLSD